MYPFLNFLGCAEIGADIPREPRDHQQFADAPEDGVRGPFPHGESIPGDKIGVLGFGVPTEAVVVHGGARGTRPGR